MPYDMTCNLGHTLKGIILNIAESEYLAPVLAQHVNQYTVLHTFSDFPRPKLRAATYTRRQLYLEYTWLVSLWDIGPLHYKKNGA